MAELEALLVACLSVDNESRRRAEEAIKVAAKKPEIVPELVDRIHSSGNPEVRQLSAVLLRKKITSLWRKLDKQTQETTKQVLLNNIVGEKFSPVRRATADVVSVIAKHTVPQGEWNNLLEFLYQCSSSQDKDHREVALLLFSSLTETIGDMLRPHFPTLQGIFLRGLQDQVDTVRIAALKAVGALAELIESEEEATRFRELLHPIAEVAKYCLGQGEDDVALRVFEIFSDLVETSSTVLQPQLPALISFSLEVAMNTGHEMGTREAALQIVHQVAEYKPKQLTRNNMAAQVVGALCTLCAEPIPEDWDDAQQLPAQKFASQALDVVALNVPSKHVFPAAMAHVQSAAGAAEPSRRASALMVVAVLAEGCAEVMRRHLGDLLQLVLAGVKDADHKVRVDAAYALGQMSFNLMPFIMEHYETVMPHVLGLLADPTPDVRKSGCYALDQFVEQMEEDQVMSYMDEMMSRLLAILAACTAAGAEEDHGAVDMALSAVASAAAAAEEGFAPYAPSVLPILRQFMSLTKEEALGARARATECAALVLSALGREAAAGTGLEEFSALVMAGMDLDHSELKEYAHCYFGHLAKLLQADFGHFLPAVVARAFASIEQADGFVGDGDGRAAAAAAGISIDVSSDEEDESGQAWTHVRTGVMDEKASACEALGIYAANTGALFLPYLEQAVGCVERMAQYFHGDVRQVAYRAMRGMVQAAVAAFPSPAPGQSSPQVKAMVDKAMTVWLVAASQDDDKGAVAAAVDMIGETVKEVGADGLGATHCDALAAVVHALFKGEAACQVVDSEADEEEDGEEEESDAEEEVLQAAVDAMAALARALGPETYAPLWVQHFEALVSHLRGGRPEPMRAVAVGAVAEMGEILLGGIEPYVTRVMPQALKELRASASGNRRNAAYCAGVLCLHGGQTGARYYMDVLRHLHPLFGEDEDSGTRDNAAGALARIIRTAGPAVPLDQAVPVLLGALPLQEDHNECEPVYDALCWLVTGEHAAATVPFLSGIISALGTAALDADTPEEVKTKVGRCVSHLHASFPDAIKPLVDALPAEQQAALSAASQR